MVVLLKSKFDLVFFAILRSEKIQSIFILTRFPKNKCIFNLREIVLVDHRIISLKCSLDFFLYCII